VYILGSKKDRFLAHSNLQSNRENINHGQN
jgi:hypothetical protein